MNNLNNLDSYLTKEKVIYNPSLDENHKLHPLFNKLIQDKLISLDNLFKGPYFWSAERFSFDQCSLYNNFSESEKEHVLIFLSKMNLSMSWYIEKCAYHHGAKMILLSDTDTEKMYYSVFANEEALHQKEFERQMNFRPQKHDPLHPLLNPLIRCIEQADKDTSIFVVQVLLEGYGMHIYKSLGESSLSNDLRNVYRRIVQEEAGHHGSGLLITDKKSIDEDTQRDIIDYIWEFSEAIQSPLFIRLALESINGKLTNTQFKKVLENISYATNAQKRLDILKNLVSRVDHWGLSKTLHSKDAFTYKERL